ncbi:MAG: hypothetical protein IT531_16205 [Burkholderiales bacterium]|nr:hypothetical protein [Burkholderiales bacterium]
MSEVVQAALGVGVSLARVVAEATAGERAVRSPAANAGPLNAIVHYGLAALTNVVGAVAGSVGAFQAGGQPGQAAANAASAPAGGRPRVHRGASLRIPLSIENPGDEPIRDAAFQCVAMQYHDAAPGRALDTGAVRCEPPTLNIMARDFEKLTVHIVVPLDTAPGAYSAQIDLGSGAYRTSIHFDVLADGA